MSKFEDLVAKLSKIYVSHEGNIVTVNPEYVYITIPAEYICIYHKILVLFANYGFEELRECCASCKDNNSSAISILNMFNAAVAAKKLKQDKLADTIMVYIKAKLSILNRGKDVKLPVTIYPIDEKGEIHAIVSCTDLPKFEVDINTGILFGTGSGSDAFELRDNKLTI